MLQVRQFRVQRRDAAAAELVRSFNDAQFVQAYQVLSSLPATGRRRSFRGWPRLRKRRSDGMRYEAHRLLVFVRSCRSLVRNRPAPSRSILGKDAGLLERNARPKRSALLEWFKAHGATGKAWPRAEPPAFVRMRLACAAE